MTQMIFLRGFSNRLKKIQIILLLLLCTGVCSTTLFAQSGAGSSGNSGNSGSSGKFRQRLEWSADKNAFEYKVEVRSGGKTVQTFTTSDNFVNLNLPAGNYEYRVSVYDFLGREQDVSGWQKFEISKANLPVFNNMEKTADFDVAAGDKITLPVEVDNISAGAKVTLVNTKTGETVAGALVIQGAATGMSEIGTAHAEFPVVSAGEWKLVVTNPSGLSAESAAITIKTYDSKAIALAKAEEEKRAAEEAARLEAARLEAEEAARLEAEEAARLEAARLEAEEAARLEAERLEAERLAELSAQAEAEQTTDSSLRDEAEQNSDSSLRDEVEAIHSNEDLAESEDLSDDLAESEDLEDSEPRRPSRIIGFEAKVGASLAANLFDSDILKTKNYDTLTSGAFPANITPAPYAALSIVPDFGWFIKPGLEASGEMFFFEYRSPSFASKPWEYRQKFTFTVIQANLLAQISPIKKFRDKFFINVKAGGGLVSIKMQTGYYSNERDEITQGFMYPKLNAGLSVELVPLKHLVIEAGADYNKVLSSKVNISYLMPYLVMGARF